MSREAGQEELGVPRHVGRGEAERAERLAALKVKLEAKVARLPEPSDDELVGEILKRRRG